jgi:hypothetical protein
MKKIIRLALLLSTLSLLTLTSAKATTYPDLTYNVTLNLANLAGYMADAPISLDLQLAQGSGNVTNTVTLSNFTFVGGTASATPNFTTGGESGSLATSLVLTNSSLDNEYATALSSGVTSISFKVDQTPNSEEVTSGTAVPDQFNVSLIDNNLNYIPTTDPSGADTLVNSALGTNATVNQYSIVAAPEPGTNALLLAGGALVGVIALRRRMLA